MGLRIQCGQPILYCPLFVPVLPVFCGGCVVSAFNQHMRSSFDGRVTALEQRLAALPREPGDGQRMLCSTTGRVVARCTSRQFFALLFAAWTALGMSWPVSLAHSSLPNPC